MSQTRSHIVRRNTKAYRMLVENAKNVVAHDLSGYFIGQPCESSAMDRYTKADALCPGKLTSSDDKHFTLHIHSNSWFTFEV